MYNLESWTMPTLSTIDDPHDWDYSVSFADGIDCHNDPEQDDLSANLYMYLRVGPERGRGYLDRAEAWAWYHTYQYPWRTWDFNYDWDGSDEQSAKTRPEISISKTSADNTFLSGVDNAKVDIAIGSDWGADHFFQTGLLDWYLLTGCRESLEAAKDLSEVSEAIYNWQTAQVDIFYWGFRQPGRHWLGATRLYEVTGAARWATLMDNIHDQVKADSSWTSSDSTGYYYTHAYDEIAPFQLNILINAMYRYYQAGGDTSVVMRDRIIRMGKLWMLNGLDATQRFSGNYMTVPSMVHNANPYPSNTVFGAGVCAIAYKLDSLQALIDSSLVFWDRGSRSNSGGTWPSYTGTTQFLCNYYDGSDFFFGNGNVGALHLGPLFYFKRLPVIVENTWYQVSNTLIDDWVSDPNPSDPGTDSWPGGLFSFSGGTKVNTHIRGYLAFGGGHNNYYQNCIVHFNVDTWEWELLADTSPKLTVTPSCLEVWTGTRPPSRHTYTLLTVHEKWNLFYACGGSVACINGNMMASSWVFNMTKRTWTRLSNFNDVGDLDPGGPPALGGVNVYAEDLDWILVGPAAYTDDVYSHDIVADDWSFVLGDYYIDDGYGRAQAEYDPVNSRFYFLGNGDTHYYEWSGSSWSGTDLSISFPPQSSSGENSSGFIWSELDSCFYGWDQDDNDTTVYKLDSLGNVTTLTPDASNSVKPGMNHWLGGGRIFDIPAMPGVFGVFVGDNSDVFLYRYAADPGMPSGAGAIPDNDDTTPPTLNGTLVANGNDSTDISITSPSADMDSCILFYPDSSTAWDTLLNAATLDTTVYSAPGTDSLYYWAIDDSSNVTAKTYLDAVTITAAAGNAGGIVKSTIPDVGTIQKGTGTGTIKD
jgi:hypothetical protein